MRLNENNIAKFNLFSIILVFIFFTMTLVLGTVFFEFKKFDITKNEIEQKYINDEKEHIKSKVQNINNVIKKHYERRNFRLEEYLKSNVNNAYKIVENIYNKNKSTKTNHEILQLIKEALRPMRFKGERGYLFINKLDGFNVLHPILPANENTNIITLQDIKGDFIVKDEIQLINMHEEGIIKSYWTKTNKAENKLNEKITYIKGFTPLNIYIGLGEYSIDFNRDYKEETLNLLNSEDYNNYIFVFDYKIRESNKFIYHPVLNNDKYENKLSYFKINEFLMLNKKKLFDKKDLYVRYNAPNYVTKTQSEKISYFLLNENWNWVIGSGFYLNDIEKEILLEEKKLYENILHVVLIEISVMFVFLLILFSIILVINNITNKIIAEYKNRVTLRKNELIQYTTIIEESNIISKTDLNGVITYASDNFCKISGYKKEELIGKTHNIIRHPDVPHEFFKGLWKTIKKGDIFKDVIKNQTKSKKTIYFQTTISPILDSNNNIIEYIATCFDITKEKELKFNLEKQNLDLKKTKDSLNNAQMISKLGSYEYNIKTGEEVWSDEVYRIFEKDINTFNPSIDEYKDLIHKDDLSYLLENMNKVRLEHKEQTYVFRINIAGKVKYLESTSKISEYEKNKPIIISGIINDITESVLHRDELILKEKLINYQSKMATMGEMIQNIAHQWKQPLNLINVTFSSLYLSKKFGTLTDEEFDETKLTINDAITYLSHTIDDFRDFFGEKKEEMFKFEIFFRKVFNLIEKQFVEYNIEIIKNIQDIQMMGNENNLLQVVLNILNNAKDELVKKDKNQRLLAFIDVFEENGKIIICIKDNAGGIALDSIEKIFQPYFTTKDKQQGTGIGLYMSEQIIKNMNGNIKVSNVEFKYQDILYKGAEFKIELLNNKEEV